MEISVSFSFTNWEKLSVSSALCSLLYILGVGVLLFYLAENVLSKNKLSPNRVKRWCGTGEGGRKEAPNTGRGGEAELTKE